MDGESTNSEPTLDARVAAVQNDVAHLALRLDHVESSVEQTRDELKDSIVGVVQEIKEMRVEQDLNLKLTKDELKSDMRELKSDMRGIEKGLKSDMRELKSDMHGIEKGLKSDMRELKSELKSDIAGIRDDNKEMLRDLKSDNAEVRSDMRTEMGHDRKVLYAFCGTAIVTMLGLLAKGVLY